jgi:hypothetical protein
MTSQSGSTPTSGLQCSDRNEQVQPKPYAHAFGMELEVLVSSDEHQPDDELPDYVESQTEVYARKQMEARTRASNLEAWLRCSIGMIN